MRGRIRGKVERKECREGREKMMRRRMRGNDDRKGCGEERLGCTFWHGCSCLSSQSYESLDSWNVEITHEGMISLDNMEIVANLQPEFKKAEYASVRDVFECLFYLFLSFTCHLVYFTQNLGYFTMRQVYTMKMKRFTYMTTVADYSCPETKFERFRIVRS